MNTAASHDEKTRLQNHYDASAQQPGPGPLALANSRSGSGSNTVPTAEEVDEQDTINTDHHHQQPPRGLTPPPYSGPSTSAREAPPSPRPAGPQFYPGLPLLDYRQYNPPLFQLSADCTTIKSTAEYLSSNASALTALIRDLAAVPPKPQVHITGRRGARVDFAVKLNLLSLLVPDDARNRLDYIRCAAHGEVVPRGGTKASALPDVGDGGLDEWARRFVDDAGAVKVFVLQREMVNFDADWVEGQVRKMVAATGYKGVVTVGFPVTHARVVVQNPDRVNKFFTSVTALFAGKRRYEVVKAVWPFATCRNGEAGRRCAVLSEETWWRQWRDSVQYAILTGRQGWVTNEDRLEAIMEGVGKNMPSVDWGPDY
ncbi:hypothetical protein B0T22DRAFT_131643 [Podospora appendiculata]|uniref:Uncharacterized protein n=1 Tax=Podospora appendiculata TaxID=314037 RepID=A0AAE0X7K1_9PEZI|nr:hypothetical protein B0T22DRAFT_131643 [Podospora appendiculata]